MSNANKIRILALLFLITETVYFGNNLFPASDAEVICDGIGILIFSISFLVPSESKKGKKSYE